MTMKQSPKQLKQSLISERIGEVTLYYSLTNKKQANLSFLQNARLLVYNSSSRQVFYLNAEEEVPFTKVPQPKKQALIAPSSRLIDSSIIFNDKWEFVFQSKQLARQWFNLLHTVAPSPKNIVKEDNRDIPQIQSRLFQTFFAQPPKNISLKPQHKKQDWNYIFYKQRGLKTIKQYEQSVKQLIRKVYPKINYQDAVIVLKSAQAYSSEANALKTQFNNYHFIVQSTKNQFILGVPLCCIVEYEDKVILVKCKLKGNVVPYSQIKKAIEPLQRYTRIRNKTLQECTFYECPYSQTQKTFYVDDLYEYVPYNELSNCYFRPQYLLDYVNELVPGGRQKKESHLLEQAQRKHVAKIGATLCLQYFMHALQLRTYLHEYGISMKQLPIIYEHSPMKHAVMSSMIARVVHKHILKSITQIKKENPKVLFKDVVESIFIIMMQDGYHSKEFWKEISLLFHSEYKIGMASNQLHPGFFLNSLMRMIPGKFDINKLLIEPTAFKSDFLKEGFIVQLSPLTQSYFRFYDEETFKLKYLALEETKSEVVCEQILEKWNVKRDNYLTLNRHLDWMNEYVALFRPPSEQMVNEQPPTRHSVVMTLRHLEWILEEESVFEREFGIMMQILRFWGWQQHPFHSDARQTLSNHYEKMHRYPEMVSAMRDALQVPYATKSLHLKEYDMGRKYLLIGQVQEALKYFNRARDGLLLQKVNTNKFGLIELYRSQIYLSLADYSLAEETALRGLRNFELFQKKIFSVGVYNQENKIKLYQILTRIYQINSNTHKYREIALQCGRVFNKCQKGNCFEEMIRLGIAAAVFKANKDKGEIFRKFVQERNAINEKDAMIRLVKISEDVGIIDNIMKRFQHFQKYIDFKNYNEENYLFTDILVNIIGLVGKDYIYSLIEQKQYF